MTHRCEVSNPAHARTLVPLRVLSFNPAASHHHCPKTWPCQGRSGGGWRSGGGGAHRLFVPRKQKQKKGGRGGWRGKGAARIGARAPRFLSLSQNTKIITRASKCAVFEMIFSLCSRGRSVECVGIRCRGGSCRGWLRRASVSGPLRPACPGRQTRGGGNLIAQPSPSLMSVYPAICPRVYLPRLAAGRCLSACRILLRLRMGTSSNYKQSFFLGLVRLFFLSLRATTEGGYIYIYKKNNNKKAAIYESATWLRD